MIISDNGRQFGSQSFKDFCLGLGIKNRFSSPGHPQANGQTEVTNWTLLKIIKAKLDDAKKAWPEELPIGMAMGRGGAEGWDLRPRLT